MAYETNDIDDFLNHRSSERSGGFLSKWRKNQPPKVNVWLHTKIKPIALWQHNFPKIFVKEDRTSGQTTRMVFGGNGWNCHEAEDVLTKQYHRDDNGNRLLYPKRCGLCRMIEVVDDLVEEGKLGWAQPLFKFEGDERNVILHAGGVCGRFGGDLTDDEKADLRARKIFDGWGQDTHAKMKWLFCVVDNGNVAGGVQIAIESKQLGDRVKGVIADAREDLGSEKGNPLVNPFCIQWQYAKEEAINNKYQARRMSTLELTPAIDRLIRGAAPDVSRSVSPFDQKTMRAFLEHHCLVQLDWDSIFAVEGATKTLEPDAAEDFPHGQNAEPADEDAPEYDADGDEIVPCEKCGQTMKLKATKCPHCGANYDASGNLLKEAPPPVVIPAQSRRRNAPADGRPKI